jgi:hypothetical protein
MLHLETGIDFFREYTAKVRSSYAKPWPRPWPCGIVWIHWDSRMTRLVRQTLDIADGTLLVELEHDPWRGAPRRLSLLCFVNQHTGHVSVSTRGPAPFLSVAYYPNVDREAALPARFWSRSAVELEDRELERLWYHNQYWLACCLREGKVAPGLFGNWTSGRIGTAWHGDYHMNYNTQQVFWGVFSSNRVEQHLPYVELCENLLPLAEWPTRRRNSACRALSFPTRPIRYPAVNRLSGPALGLRDLRDPWTVQSLWWHYLYTQDEDYLRRAYPLLRAGAFPGRLRQEG